MATVDEKYQLTLTGPQIDDALLQMNIRAPEGWTRGTRDGVAVGSASEYYHNNAMYYANRAASDISSGVTRAEAAAARAEAAVPSGTAGAVFFDRSQSLTTEQQAQARKNIVAGGSNRNLLDNPWFANGHIVNQRGVATISSTSSPEYFVDRWKISRAVGSITSNGLSWAWDGSTSNNGALQQILGVNYVDYALTASVIIDNTLHSWSFTASTSGNRHTFSINGKNFELVFDQSGSRLVLFNYSTTASVLKAVKLELGSYSTLANDAPPNYAEELAKCQRYFIRYIPNPYDYPIGEYICPNATLMNCFMPLPVALRANPKVSSTITFKGVKPDGTTFTAGSINATGVARANGVNFILNTSGQTAMSNGKLSTTTAGYIDFSADL